MQRLFSTFANGWPGRGLLIQRLLTGAVLFYSAIAFLAKDPPLLSTAPYMIGAGAGVFLVLGLWTPVTGTVVAVAERVVVDPLVAEVLVLRTPRLHTAVVLVLVQLPVEAVAALPGKVAFVPCTVAVRMAPVTGSPVL